LQLSPRPQVDVLVVDDDQDAREILVDVLTLQGFRVVSAMNGAEAWRMLNEGLRPRFAILDVMMPGMSGLDLQKRMLEEPALARIRVIILSAVPHFADDVPGIAAILRKPIAPDALLRCIDQVLTAPAVCQATPKAAPQRR
jgi:CheY-like chemotaxis protein